MTQIPLRSRFDALSACGVSTLALLLGTSIATAQSPDFVPRGQYELFADALLTVPGLTGSYVNQNLGGVASPADWRVTQTIAGTRIDLKISFPGDDWGNRSALNLTGGTNSNWDSYSVQWDGWVRIPIDGMTLSTYGDDSSRLWIDVDGNGSFTNAAPELANNHWGSPGIWYGEPTTPLAAGTYRIRIQYEEGGGGNFLHLIPAPTVRIAYLVPSNRNASPNAIAGLRDMANAWQSWLCDYTARNLGAPAKLRMEVEPTGAPTVHVVPLAETDAYLRVDPWGRCITAAAAAGVPVWQRGQVWLLVPLIHAMQQSGVIDGRMALGAGFGSGDDPGVAMLNSVGVELAAGGGITNPTSYGGRVVPEIGPFPLVDGVSFPWFEGSTVSSVVSSYYGAGLHELGHALGLGHDARNDDNAHGNLMYNGLRGFRGALFPALFPEEDCRLEFATALTLRNCRYMTSCGPRLPGTGPSTADAMPPQITVSTSGAVSLVAGRLPIQAQITDDVELSVVLLAKEGETIEEQPVVGTSASVTFSTPWFDPGVARNYQITAYDKNGNRVQQSTSIIAGAGNRAPLPKFRATRSEVTVQGRVLLDASGSSDPEFGPLSYEWDLEGDGVWTAPSSSATRVVSYTTAWPRLVRVRVTDALGASSVSAPIAVRVRPADPSPFHATVGTGSPGCRGVIGLHGTAQPASGLGSFALETTNAPATSAGLIVLATQATPACTQIAGLGPVCFHFQPWSLLDVQPVASDGNGNGHLPLPVPIGLAGLQVVLQTVWIENGNCLVPAPNYATSNGLRLTLF